LARRENEGIEEEKEKQKQQIFVINGLIFHSFNLGLLTRVLASNFPPNTFKIFHISNLAPYFTAPYVPFLLTRFVWDFGTSD
jgi:hypothetical protein